ncbi:diacylglycerol kinase family protein [Corynebacterium flavescens]|uniref:Uncharacterized protein n=1 Tax=Corynebacterium flavescens TaxID=28028 RepID=A0AB73B4S9_CORFL|nr:MULTISPECIES: diacylglycerol kinase family protein [Corynebacterium]KAA8720084.1 hypothetical protein F4V60_11015 [Corynebacterium flavescens]MDN6099252.1 hypothetical protein [Corynebacterium flavescens]MDN6198334.1 hypothetical protein [Corynebacterium flavescens]MDN6225453.1 hypothetical protein [Corynebacterium flavescens]MDN6236366.1 hypothetical protein [Corynebacterium flavescens]
MALLILLCGSPAPGALPDDAQVEKVGAIPTRGELRVLDALAESILPVDSTPSLDEIAAQPDVEHLGTPAFAPQEVPEPLRVVVVGSDGALSAVLTRMMRADYMWVEVSFVPVGPSPARQNWGIPEDPQAALELALRGQVRPVPLIRNDAGLAVAGSAVIAQWERAEITGEIIVDNEVLLRQGPGKGAWGARLVPMLDAPGIVAARALGPLDPAPRGIGRFLAQVLRRPIPGRLDPQSVLTGRAVQAGGPQLRVLVDGVSAKRPLKRVTFYRHLRDLQVVRP